MPIPLVPCLPYSEVTISFSLLCMLQFFGNVCACTYLCAAIWACIYLCITIFVGVLACFTEEVQVKPLKNQNCPITETAFESVSYTEGLPFPFLTPPPHMTPRGLRATSTMNRGNKESRDSPKSLPSWSSRAKSHVYNWEVER